MRFEISDLMGGGGKAGDLGAGATRREWMKAVGRYGALAVLVGGVGYLAGRRACARTPCGACPMAARCDLAKAQEARARGVQGREERGREVRESREGGGEEGGRS